ncbi:SgrR family transcriptional regulator [Enterobacter cloacae complex sp. I2]|uniref:SgrR family transcriptional regulator n=1 Tax=Enterobacter cloacae complex sp. I2 TaxID=2779603 RepID=UPI001868F5EE|nr:SgrR family transcriptional regulator [Enterobacter cloacae complex sp. I2]MBE3513129.1 SgrR family transcriptional regulator [Enterobacter cloacae complex sp. I2]
MTYRLSPHEKRLLTRYQRLLMRWRTAPVQVSMGEIAEVLYCTSRYARSLLRDMQQAGWLCWTARPGRGAGGVLQCRVDAAALQTLLDGKYAIQTESTEAPAPAVKEEARDGECFSLRFYRPLMKVTPSLYTGWPERHLIQMVHVGLMRFLPGSVDPVPGLAHTAEVSPDGLTWTFYLRRGLFWHNGEPLMPEQLLPALQRHAGGPGLPHVVQVKLSDYVLQMMLKTPDALLPHRLAHPAYALSHPENQTVGLGPYRVCKHAASVLVLQRSAFWYGEQPQTTEVRFMVQQRPAPDWSIITLENARAYETSPHVTTQAGEGGFTFLTFNTTRTSMSQAQQDVVRRIVQSLLPGVIDKVPTIAELPEWLRVNEAEVESAKLPPELNIVYCLMPETTALVEQLKKSLQWRGCHLNITTRAASHWLLPSEEWASFDFCIGFQPLFKRQAAMLEEHFRHCPMFHLYWGKKSCRRGQSMLIRAVKGTRQQHTRRIWRLFNLLLQTRLITPLYIQRWQLHVPAGTRGVETCELGWPDFTYLWMA